MLAAGTLGPTLLVDGPDSQPPLVVKLITTAVGTDADALADALAPHVAAPIADPGVVPVTAVGIDSTGVYLVAPYVEAPTLESRLRGGRQSLSQVLEWLVGPAGALAAAHQQARLHGALHPRDVLLPRGRGVLTGLDISPALEAVGLQAPVRVPFTAPERASGKPWDARADQYSLAMLALDALSGRRLIAGTIPAFDRWTLADTPGEDARLHEVFARALNPDPSQRFASVAEWLAALTGAAEPASELSRFTREGVIPAAAPDLRRTPPTDEVDEAKSLALFPEEEPSTDASPGGQAQAAAVSDTSDGADRPVSPTGEWLVASMPDDAPPLADTGPLPIQSLSAHDETPAPAAAVVPVHADHSDFALRSTEDAEDLDPDVVRTADAEPWRDVASDAEEPRRRSGLVVAAVLLVVALLAFGTWRSLTRPDVPDAAAVSGGAAGAASATTAAPDPASAGPAAVTEEALRPSAEDVQPGAAPPQAPPDAVAGRRDDVSPKGPQPAAPPRAAAATTPRADRPASPVAAPQPEAPLSTALARVLIRSSPAGQVRVNGRPRGQTPIVLRDLPFGSYMVVISRPGYVDAVRQVDVLPSQPVASLSVDLERQTAEGVSAPAAPASGAPGTAPAAAPASTTGAGSLYVVSRPTDAHLFIDGQAYGTAPAVVPGLRAGRHLVRVQLPGYRAWEQSVDVQPGQRVRVDATLLPESR